MIFQSHFLNMILEDVKGSFEHLFETFSEPLLCETFTENAAFECMYIKVNVSPHCAGGLCEYVIAIFVSVSTCLK